MFGKFSCFMYLNVTFQALIAYGDMVNYDGKHQNMKPFLDNDNLTRPIFDISIVGANVANVEVICN